MQPVFYKCAEVVSTCGLIPAILCHATHPANTADDDDDDDGGSVTTEHLPTDKMTQQW